MSDVWACAISGVPIHLDRAVGLLVERAQGRWRPFTLGAVVEVGEFGAVHAAEPTAHDQLPFALAELAAPANTDPGEWLGQRLADQRPWPLGGLVEVTLALVHRSVAAEIRARARPLFPESAQVMLTLALPNPRSRAFYGDEMFDGHHPMLRLGAALTLLQLELDPFRPRPSTHAGPDEAFAEAFARTGTLPWLHGTIGTLRDRWSHRHAEDWLDEHRDDDDDDDRDVDAPPPLERVVLSRDVIGRLTLAVPTALCARLLAQLDGASDEALGVTLREVNDAEVPVGVDPAMQTVRLDAPTAEALRTSLREVRGGELADGRLTLVVR